ncbi:MAG TPA: DUF2917 domain-containing protein [Casimicrobiaceae bacterium]
MACYETATIIDMGAREAITLQDVRGTTLRVTRGTIWLTQENDRKDVVLRVGDNWVVERDGATVVEAQDDAVVCVVGRRIETGATPRRTPVLNGHDWRGRLAALFGERRYAPYY